MTLPIEKAVGVLEGNTKRVHSYLGFSQRAFVIEFAGTPKSGKSTAVEAVRHFFSRHGFRVHVLSERAAACPIPMKGHLFFNTWCATSMLAELLENVETETDIIIVDRGIFDALVWLQLQKNRGELTQSEAKTIEAFLLLERWRALIDLSVVMRVDARVAMKRETSQRITNKPGSIMNPEVLGSITQSVKAAERNYGKKFPLLSMDTSASKDVRRSNIELANKIVSRLEESLNPRILVVSKKEIEKLPLIEGGAFNKTYIKKAIRCIAMHGKYMRRSEAEKSNLVVQIVIAGVLTSEDRVFVFQRKESDPKYKLYGHNTVWQGTHVSKRIGISNNKILETTLMDRITRSLFLSRVFSSKLIGYCWDRTEEHSSRHFGILFQIKIDNIHTATDLKKKEFRRGKGRGHDLVGQFTSWSKLRNKQNSALLEPWSKAILRNFSRK